MVRTIDLKIPDTIASLQYRGVTGKTLKQAKHFKAYGISFSFLFAKWTPNKVKQKLAPSSFSGATPVDGKVCLQNGKPAHIRCKKYRLGGLSLSRALSTSVVCTRKSHCLRLPEST